MVVVDLIVIWGMTVVVLAVIQVEVVVHKREVDMVMAMLLNFAFSMKAIHHIVECFRDFHSCPFAHHAIVSEDEYHCLASNILFDYYLLRKVQFGYLYYMTCLPSVVWYPIS